jgi:hypothetical protein
VPDQRFERTCRPLLVDVLLAHTKREHLVLRQINPAPLVILSHIAKDVRQLHRVAHRDRLAVRPRLAEVEHVAHDQPHHARDVVAVALEFVPVGIPLDRQIHPASVRQFEEWFHRHLSRANGVGEGP